MNFKKSFKKLGFRTPSTFRAERAVMLAKNFTRQLKKQKSR